MKLIVYESPAIEADPARIRQMFETNVFGVFDMVAAFSPLLLASVPESQTPPTIINTASILGRLPYPFAAAYNASKAAIASYSDTLRIELAPLGIKVITLFMGEVSTGLMSTENTPVNSDSLYAASQGAVRQRVEQHIQKSMKPEEFARQVVKGIVSKRAIGKGEYLWKGTNATIVWLLNAVGWRKIFDGLMQSGVGFDKKEVRKAIFYNGQRSTA